MACICGQLLDEYELCPMGGQYIYRYNGKDMNDITLVHDGCHADKSYSLNLILDYFYMLHIAFPGYSSLRCLSKVEVINCVVFLNPCFSEISKITMAPERCAAVLETPWYSTSHALPNKCRYNISSADIMTGSATLGITLMYPNFI